MKLMIRAMAAVIAGLLAGCCAARAAEVSAPALMPKADYSTPRKAAVTYFNALRFADWPALRDGMEAPTSELKAAETYIRATAAERDLEAAALAQFGPHQDRISDSYLWAELWNDWIAAFSSEGVKVTVTQDENFAMVAALVKHKVGGRVELVECRMDYMKAGDAWKRVGSMPGSGLPGAGALLIGDEWREKLFTKEAADIRAGKYKTFEEANKALDAEYLQRQAEVAKEAAPANVTLGIHNGKLRMTRAQDTVEADSISLEGMPKSIKGMNADGKEILPVVTTAGMPVGNSESPPPPTGRAEIQSRHGKVVVRWGVETLVADKVEMDVELPPLAGVKDMPRPPATEPAPGSLKVKVESHGAQVRVTSDEEVLLEAARVEVTPKGK